MSDESTHQKNCKNALLVTDVITGEISCNNCGVVLSEKVIDFGPENIGQTKEAYQSNARTGQKISLKMADMGLFTIIQSQDKDSTGKPLSGHNKRSFYRLRMWDRNSRSAVTKQSLLNAFTLLDGLRSKLGLPEHVVEKSAYLFRKVKRKKLLLGRSNRAVLCAVVYIACRLTDTPRTITDVAKAGGVKNKIIYRLYRLLASNLDIHSKSYSPDEFITRISNEVMISEKTKRDARKILEIGQKKGLNEGKHPMSMAAAAVYLGSQRNNEKVSQMNISRVSGISAVTIRNRVKELEALQTK
ncbi:MAG: transcription factor TFIIB [Nitrosopumilus sp.]|nr:transcription factor TFIIB [Nitrosopumilus sp.]